MTTTEARTVSTTDDLKALIGEDLGPSEWVTVTQEQVQLFADATGDQQWIHVDVEKAKDGPFGGTIAHGYLTLSMGPALLDDILHVEGFAGALNYGAGKVRFPHPVPVGSRLRMTARTVMTEEVTGGLQVTFRLTFEIEGIDKPACVADVIYRFLV